jgi:hypothetical protein
MNEWPGRRRDRYQRNTQETRTSMPTAGFEPAIPANVPPRTYAVYRTAIYVLSFCNFVLLALQHEQVLDWLLIEVNHPTASRAKRRTASIEPSNSIISACCLHGFVHSTPDLTLARASRSLTQTQKVAENTGIHVLPVYRVWINLFPRAKGLLSQASDTP